MRTKQATEQHPPSFRARLARALRFMCPIRGWGRVVSVLVPQSWAGPFIVINQSGVFAGDLSSFIDRRMYLFGEYEQSLVREFIQKIPLSRRGTVLDIGANVGTHSLAFGRHFKAVHAFEPNSQLWQNFQRNVALNNLAHVHLHRVGLGEVDAELPFYLIDKTNYGLGTFSTTWQYDLPLQEIGKMKVRAGDSYVDAARIGPIDAIKIDVQGFELEVLRGLAKAIQKDRPFIWLEIGTGTVTQIATTDSLRALFPYPCELFRFESHRRIVKSTRLRLAPEGILQPSDYLVAPLMGSHPQRRSA